MLLHVNRHLVDAGQVLALDHTVEIHVTEACHLLQDVLLQVLLCAQDEDVGLYADALQLLHRVLCRLGLKLTRSAEVGHIGEVNVDGVLSQLPFELTYGLHERCALYVADGSANLGDDEIVMIFLSKQLDVALYLVGDVWHHLYGLAQVVAVSLFVNDRLVDASCGERVGLGRLYACEAFVVAEVEVGLHTVDGDIALAVLVWIECSRIDVDVRVKLLDGDVVASCLQELTDRRRDDAFS